MASFHVQCGYMHSICSLGSSLLHIQPSPFQFLIGKILFSSIQKYFSIQFLYEIASQRSGQWQTLQSK